MGYNEDPNCLTPIGKIKDIDEIDLPFWCKGGLRDAQKEAYELGVGVLRDFKNLIIQMPTGGGKTLLATSLAQGIGARCNYIATTHDLQNQCRRDFETSEIIKGRRN